MAVFQTLGVRFNTNANGRNFFPTRHSLEVPDGTYTIGDTLTVQIQENPNTVNNDPRNLVDVQVTFIGYEDVTFYPLFEIESSFEFKRVAFNTEEGFFLATNEPDPSIANPNHPQVLSDPTNTIRYRIGTTPGSALIRTAGAQIEIDSTGGGFDVTFSNVAIHQGNSVGGAYQLLGSARTIPVGTYGVGDTERGGGPLELEDHDGNDLRVEFVGYQDDTNYPIFKTVDQLSSGEDLYFILTDEPGAGGTNYQVLSFDVTTGAYTTCFAPGTLIATPDGERAVETLKPGDMVLTADGDTVPVKWLGFQKVPTMFGARELTHPVRIRAGALGRNVPHTDLVVTKDHGMIIDGVICHAGALINGTSITEVPTRELNADPKGVVTYYHVEIEGHVPLLANGAASESFIDNVSRETFTNHAEFVGMYGARVPPMTEMNLPRAMSMRQVPLRIRTRLARRAAIILAPSGVRRLWQDLRDRVRSARRRLGIAWNGA